MRTAKKKINIGIGFVTGRKNFQNVLKTYIANWNESGVFNKGNSLNLFIAYDLAYKNTKASDYKIADVEVMDLLDSAHYLSASTISNESRFLMDKKVITAKEAKLVFSDGYAGKRNLVLYYAIKSKMDYLIFLDDDEYPLSVMKIDESLMWTGQEVLATHLRLLPNCDITHGHHCGYVSPIPAFQFNDVMTEDDFKLFITSLSNDIITWVSIKEKMINGGIQYADPFIMAHKDSYTVEEINGMKFISGANLGLNLKNKDKLFAFYNPPRARGEDTFLSTCLGKCDIQKVPCYTFHDGFSEYNHLLLGVLPKQLKTIQPDKSAVQKRFYNACLGWIRYKPLLMFLTNRENYESEIKKIEADLAKVLPNICEYFSNNNFNKLLEEFKFYTEHVEEHNRDFQNTKDAWKKIMGYLNN